MMASQSTEPSDKVLMVQVAGGDESAFTILIRRHQSLVLASAYRYIGDRTEAEDVAQEVFLRLWRSAKKYRPETALGAYIRKITVNFCLDLKRKSRFQMHTLNKNTSSPENPHADIEASERQRALKSAIQMLPPTQHMAVILFHMEGLSMKEVSDLLEISPKAVESLLSRARATLRDRLSPILA